MVLLAFIVYYMKVCSTCAPPNKENDKKNKEINSLKYPSHNLRFSMLQFPLELFVSTHDVAIVLTHANYVL
jgi:hypothetical protein